MDTVYGSRFPRAFINSVRPPEGGVVSDGPSLNIHRVGYLRGLDGVVGDEMREGSSPTKGGEAYDGSSPWGPSQADYLHRLMASVEQEYKGMKKEEKNRKEDKAKRGNRNQKENIESNNKKENKKSERE
eukprot:TRINITY_DN94472_c3_g1_i1.p3 TRINITY_DN94472_c3_g1~~TRINITY_DN94472_c3_g1_i1.p3  ORF type:complete len:129 (+),score=20.61 TRINITY_DN94472_c3_g1_i1:3-389(+)